MVNPMDILMTSSRRLHVSNANFATWVAATEVPEKEIGAWRLATEQSHGSGHGQGFLRCRCKLNCQTKRCRCFKEGNLCTSKCHTVLHLVEISNFHKVTKYYFNWIGCLVIYVIKVLFMSLLYFFESHFPLINSKMN